jgi:hypothetical protein
MSNCVFSIGLGRCLALTQKRCLRCTFYKSRDEYELFIEKSRYYNTPVKAVRKKGDANAN